MPDRDTYLLAAFTQLNWLAVLLATLAYYILGAAWFTPLFGKEWDRAIGYNRSRAKRFDPGYYLVPLVSALSVSLALGVILAAIEPQNIGETLLVGALLGLFVAAAISINNALTPHTPLPYALGIVTGGYHFFGIVVASAIIDAFPS